ncbi:MAG: LarC family nickel insertion protein [Coriobacteriales bacterium]|nr:LarC family nickel insertion protein [Coriobacteriales bacterium]
MKEISLDLSKDATRQNIYKQLSSQINSFDLVQIDAIISDAAIDSSNHYHNFFDVCDAIDASIASEYAKRAAKLIYNILNEAESKVHNVTIDKTHFHEVGNGKTIKEILQICECLNLLKLTKIQIGLVQTGQGKITCHHGILDIPAPATTSILDKYNIPLSNEKLEGELCTPTSAAIIAFLLEYYS